MFIFLTSIFRYILPKKTTAITLWPFIVFKNKADIENTVLINHERIHLRQQLELLILPFYILYLCEYVVLLFRYKNAQQAYLSISFEREAYTHQADLNYLSKRRFWAMWANKI
jgi:hypothetical protein